jgi:hypothetical protein
VDSRENKAVEFQPTIVVTDMTPSKAEPALDKLISKT